MPTLKVAQDLIDIFYPVGTYYETSDSDFDPNIEWGGTWVQDTNGRFLVAFHSTDFPTINSTGGSKYLQKHTHTRGTMEIEGSFYGDEVSRDCGVTATGAFMFPNQVGGKGGFMGGGFGYNLLNGFSFKASRNWTGATSEAGTGNSENLPPYKVCKRWHRTA